MPVIHTYKGYDIYLPNSGGKAGKGNNKTTTLQIRKHNQIVKTFHFKTADFEYQRVTELKAKAWIDMEVNGNHHKKL